MIKKIVSVIILNNEGKMLLLHRCANRRSLPDFWNVCSGHIESDESPDECFRREINEELGIVDFHLIKKSLWIDNITNSELEFETHVYLIKTVQDVKIIDIQEHDKFVWIHPEEISDYKIIKALYKDLECVGIKINK